MIVKPVHEVSSSASQVTVDVLKNTKVGKVGLPQ